MTLCKFFMTVSKLLYFDVVVIRVWLILVVIWYEYAHTPECEISHVSFPFLEFVIMINSVEFFPRVGLGMSKKISNHEKVRYFEGLLTLCQFWKYWFTWKSLRKSVTLPSFRVFIFGNDLMWDIQNCWNRFIHLLF